MNNSRLDNELKYSGPSGRRSLIRAGHRSRVKSGDHISIISRRILELLPITRILFTDGVPAQFKDTIDASRRDRREDLHR